MVKRSWILLITFHLCTTSTAQNTTDPFAHTYSIVARDSITGEIGVAVESHAFSVGTAVPWGEAGVGVVATQSYVNRSFGPDGLKLLKEGKSVEEIVKALTDADPGRDNRQLGILDMNGNAACYTGKNCIAYAGHYAEKNLAVQANMMLNDKVITAMTKAFKETSGTLAERMMAALESAQQAGGDVRGQQSAAMIIVNPVATGFKWKDQPLDLRVDDHPDPITELKRLLTIILARKHAQASYIAIENNDMMTATREFQTAINMLPNNIETQFWYAVTLVNHNQTEAAMPIFKTVFNSDDKWALLFSRLRKAGELTCDEATERKILNQ